MRNFNLLTGGSHSIDSSDSQPADLWDYSFAFGIREYNQLPAGGYTPSADEFRRALFLPRDDPDWFGRSSYFPRVLVLERQALTCIEYRRRRVSKMVFALGGISQVEIGHALLQGWLTIIGKKERLRLPFNTRSHSEIESFVNYLLDSLLLPMRFSHEPVRLGPEVGFKLANECSRYVRKDELQLVSLSLPEQPGRTRWSRRTAASLLVLTDRRLLWVTELCEGRTELYGATTISARPEAVTGFDLTHPRSIAVAFSNGSSWVIPFSEELRSSAEEFTRVFDECVQNPARKKPRL